MKVNEATQKVWAPCDMGRLPPKSMLGEVSGKQVSVCVVQYKSDSREGACDMTCKFGCKHSTTNNQKVTHARQSLQ